MPQTMDLLNQLSTAITAEKSRIGIVLAAGHGKRIRSETSKMLHQIWGRPTVLRVALAVQEGLESPNQVIVVGIKAEDVASATGSQCGRIFAYQENLALGRPAGTGDAAQIALAAFEKGAEDRDIYIFLGDMGLLTSGAVGQFRRYFATSSCDMMVLTGGYSGPIEQNYYGRIVRVPAADCDGNPAAEDLGKVIEIKEHKDILGLDPTSSYNVIYNGRSYAFTRDQLLAIREINTGVFAFKERQLRRYIHEIKTDNVQGELMLTDMVHILNRHGRVVRAMQAANEEEILAFNNKSVLSQMESIARRWAYERLMDTISIADEEDFFIADETIEQIIALDRDKGPLDLGIGKGVHIGPQVQLNRHVQIGDHSHLSGNIVIGERVWIGPGVQLSTYPDQTMILADGVQILARNILKGNLQIAAESRIESGVIMTGSNQFPMRVGQRVTVKGTSYLYGCHVDDDLLIEHSIIQCKHVEQVLKRDGNIQPIRYVLPPPEGLDSLAEL